MYQAIGMAAVWVAATVVLGTVLFLVFQALWAACVVAGQVWRLMVVHREPWSARRASLWKAWAFAFGHTGVMTFPHPWADRAAFAFALPAGAIVAWGMFA